MDVERVVYEGPQWAAQEAIVSAMVWQQLYSAGAYAGFAEKTIEGPCGVKCLAQWEQKGDQVHVTCVLFGGGR